MREEEQHWIMAVVGALAGGQSAKDAVATGDKVREAFKTRFPRDREDD